MRCVCALFWSVEVVLTGSDPKVSEYKGASYFVIEETGWSAGLYIMPDLCLSHYTLNTTLIPPVGCVFKDQVGLFFF